MRHILENSELIVLFLIVILATYLSGGFSFDTSAHPTVDPATYPGATLIQPTTGPTPKAGSGLQMQNLNFSVSAGAGLHGAFYASSSQDLQFALANNVSYVIQDETGTGADGALNPGTDLGGFFNAHASQIKAYVNMYGYISNDTICGKKQPCGTCSVTDDSAVTQFVKDNMNNPALGGYWIKDDSLLLNYCHNLGVSVKQLYNDIRSVDTNKTHLVMAGFGAWDEMGYYGGEDFFMPGMADVIMLYPYPTFSGGISGANTQFNWMENHIQSLSNSAGQPAPITLGAYQAFNATYGPSEILQNVKDFFANGASGVAGFDLYDAGQDSTSTIKSVVQAVNNCIQTDPACKPLGTSPLFASPTPKLNPGGGGTTPL